jgi:hypothetical protein
MCAISLAASQDPVQAVCGDQQRRCGVFQFLEVACAAVISKPPFCPDQLVERTIQVSYVSFDVANAFDGGFVVLGQDVIDDREKAERIHAQQIECRPKTFELFLAFIARWHIFHGDVTAARAWFSQTWLGQAATELWQALERSPERTDVVKYITPSPE